LQARRTKPVSFLTTFDAPVMTVNCERRSSSTGAQQSLMLMNSDFVLKQSGLFAQRVRSETPVGYADQVAQGLAGKYARQAEAWQFGYGAFDGDSQRVAKFMPLPHFTGSSWQGGTALPDPQVGWAILHAEGGHAGNDADHAVIRRWAAPQAGTLSIRGKLHHPSPNGDGVRGRIVSSRNGLLGEWSAKEGDVVSNVEQTDVQPGETIDFVVDCRENVNSDSFTWKVELQLSMAKEAGASEVLAYHSAAHEVELGCQFVLAQMSELRTRGDQTDPELTALTSLCQQLLSSNEFLYAD
jgi:hypothetical protein